LNGKGKTAESGRTGKTPEMSLESLGKGKDNRKDSRIANHQPNRN